MDFILGWNNWEGRIIFPYVPNDSIRLTRGQSNIVYDGINGQLNALGNMELAEFDFESWLPSNPRNTSNARPVSNRMGWKALREIEAARLRKIPFRAILLDNNGKEVFNLAVSLETLEYGIDQARDIAIKMHFREYRFAEMPLVAELPSQGEPAGSEATVAPDPLTPVMTSSQAADFSNISNVQANLTPKQLNKLAIIVYGEAGGIPSRVEKACVAWTVFNRVDSSGWGDFDDVAIGSQFNGLWKGKTDDECTFIATDVAKRWTAERAGQLNVGRVLPKDYCWFMGDLVAHNWFCNVYHQGKLSIAKAHAWDYSLPSPY